MHKGDNCGGGSSAHALPANGDSRLILHRQFQRVLRTGAAVYSLLFVHCIGAAGGQLQVVMINVSSLLPFIFTQGFICSDSLNHHAGPRLWYHCIRRELVNELLQWRRLLVINEVIVLQQCRW